MQNDGAPTQNDAPELLPLLLLPLLLLLLLLPLLPPLLLLLLLLLLHFHWLFTSLAFTAGPAWVALLWPTVPIAVFFFSFVSGAVIRCAMKILPWKIIRDARKSRQTCCFWTMPRTMPKRCPPWWKQRLPRAQSIKPKLAHSRWPHTPAKHLCTSLAYYDVTPLVKRKAKAPQTGLEPGTLRLLAVRTNHWAKLILEYIWKLEM